MEIIETKKKTLKTILKLFNSVLECVTFTARLPLGN